MNTSKLELEDGKKVHRERRKGKQIQKCMETVRRLEEN